MAQTVWVMQKQVYVLPCALALVCVQIPYDADCSLARCERYTSLAPLSPGCEPKAIPLAVQSSRRSYIACFSTRTYTYILQCMYGRAKAPPSDLFTTDSTLIEKRVT